MPGAPKNNQNRKLPAGTARTVAVGFKVSEDEKRELDLAVKASGMSPPDYMRSLLFGARVKVVMPPVDLDVYVNPNRNLE